MAERTKGEEIIANLKAKGIFPYSISKLNAIDGCLREAFYSYKCKDERRNREQSIYGIMGSEIHDVLERIYNNEAKKEDLLSAMQKELADADLCGIDFPRDFKGGTAIRDSWIADMTHFCNSFEILPGGNFTTEEFVLLKISDTRYLIGYVDLIQVVDVENKVVDIYDFKTSSMFKKDDLMHHGRQLVVYGMAMEQAGYTVRNLAWIMLKYVEVTFEGYARSNSKNKSTITKVIQRGKIAKELSGQVERMLDEAGYSELDTEILVANFIDKNSFDVLPMEIAKEFEIKQYIQPYDFTEELQQEALDYINVHADAFEELWKKPEDEWTPVDIGEKGQSFYCNNLCSHRSVCPELRQYNAMLELDKTDDEDLF